MSDYRSNTAYDVIAVELYDGDDDYIIGESSSNIIHEQESMGEKEPENTPDDITPIKLRFRSIIAILQEKVAIIILLILSFAQTVTARIIISGGGLASANNGLHRGLGFVWKSFGNLKKAVRRSSSLKDLKLFKYSLLRVRRIFIKDIIWPISQNYFIAYRKAS